MAHPSDDAAQAQSADRPRPAYGELAPEGWEWTPETNDGGRANEASPASGGSGTPVNGVPHNLGARGDGSAAASAPVSAPASAPSAGSRDPEPYRAPAPQAPQAPRESAPPRAGEPSGPQSGFGAPQRKPRTADRVITIILLVLGMFGSLNFAGSMMSLPASLSLMGSAFEIENFTVPSWVGAVGTVTAIAIFAVFAVNLIFSIQRMRARKLAFWVPLTAGAIVVIGTIIVTAVVLFNVPELMSAASDPTAMQKLLDSLSEMSQP
ncbi:DUF6264 family protein [Leucobacter chromiiresistens]|uniref:Uncharacterized protein n=1 Tax=Leucobacter chromiiresistens TaxID=1079994 RepID=A0A147EPJ7_9MICO|nr:DUF6264 family protein [Leucobacter chromiiresistens]KTR86292.1 hypothetical protein NS354_05570 [Leucobacter chromiiresistens]